jgi:hypothetical protein
MAIGDLFRASETTLLLCPVVGGYLCLSAAGLLRRGAAEAFLENLRDNPAIMHAVGAIAMFVGAGILAFHQHWSTPAEIVLNLICVWWVIEGAGMLADSGRLARLFANPRASGWLRATHWLMLAVGLYLLVFVRTFAPIT